MVHLENFIPNIKGLGLSVSEKKIYRVFPYMSLCKTSDLGVLLILPQCNNLNNFDRGLQEKATFQISKACAFLLKSNRFVQLVIYVKNELSVKKVKVNPRLSFLFSNFNGPMSTMLHTKPRGH